MSGVEALGFLVAEFLFASCCLERSDLGAWGGVIFFTPFITGSDLELPKKVSISTS